jgi:ubiquitin C-terminal hydrolase
VAAWGDRITSAILLDPAMPNGGESDSTRGCPAGGGGQGSPASFPNLGNTCYISSVTQVLLHTPGLGELPEGELLSKLSQSPSAESFVQFVSSLGEKGAPYRAEGAQQDAAEFFGWLLGRGRDLAKLFKGTTNATTTCADCGTEHKRQSVELPHSTLHLSVRNPNDYKDVESLKGALDLWSEAPHESFTCSNSACPGLSQQLGTERNVFLDPAPRNLAVCLKRFSKSSEKLCHEVRLEQQLSLCVNHEQDEQEPRCHVQYGLYAVVTHVGTSLRGGHYIAFVRRDDG